MRTSWRGPALDCATAEGDRAAVDSCTKHWNERALEHCDDCGEPWCAMCLVPPLRKGMPLRCVPCSLVAAGVRTKRRVR